MDLLLFGLFVEHCLPSRGLSVFCYPSFSSPGLPTTPKDHLSNQWKGWLTWTSLLPSSIQNLMFSQQVLSCGMEQPNKGMEKYRTDGKNIPPISPRLHFQKPSCWQRCAVTLTWPLWFKDCQWLLLLVGISEQVTLAGSCIPAGPWL